MIPSPWAAVVLALAVFRLCRLAGWDHFPLAVRVRAWVVGELTVTHGSTNERMGVTAEGVRYVSSYRRVFLHELISCPFCLSFWLGILAYVAWRLEPGWTLALLFPLALSAAAGLIAKQWDP